MLRKFLKAVSRLVAVLAGLAVVVYVAAVVWNWRDEEPSPDALRLAALYEVGAETPDDDNAYVYMLGFEAPLDQSPREVGTRRLEWLRSTAGTPVEPASDPLSARVPVSADPAVEQFLRLCDDDTRACANAFADSGGSVLETWIAAEPWLLERYREFIAHDGWREYIPAYLHPHAGAAAGESRSVRRGQRLLLLRVKQLADAGDGAAVRDLLGRDARFWRSVLASADTLLGKMMAVTAMRQHFTWGSLAVRTLPAGSMAEAIPAEWETPMTSEELGLGQALAGEWTLISAAWTPERLRASAPLATRMLGRALEPLHRQQARANRRATAITALLDTLDALLLELDTIVAELGLLRRRSAAPLPDSVANIAVKLDDTEWGRGFAEGMSRYARRAADVEGMRRAAVAVVTLRNAGIPQTERAAALSFSPWRNPYDDRPLRWDASDAAVVFSGLELGERGEYRFHY